MDSGLFPPASPSIRESAASLERQLFKPILVGSRRQSERGHCRWLQKNHHCNVLRALELFDTLTEDRKSFWASFEYVPIDLTHVVAAPIQLREEQVLQILCQVRVVFCTVYEFLLTKV